MIERPVYREIPLVPDDHPAEVAQPGERPLHLPSPPVLSELSPVLRLRLHPFLAMRADHLDALGRQPLPQRVTVVAPVEDHPLGPPEGLGVGVTLMASSVGSSSLNSARLAESRWEASGRPSPSTTTIHFVPLPFFVSPTPAPPFSPGRTAHRRSTPPSGCGPRRSVRQGTPSTPPARCPAPPARLAAASRARERGIPARGPSSGPRCGAPKGCPRRPGGWGPASGRPWARLRARAAAG